MKPPTDDPSYLTNVTTAIYQVALPPSISLKSQATLPCLMCPCIVIVLP